MATSVVAQAVTTTWAPPKPKTSDFMARSRARLNSSPMENIEDDAELGEDADLLEFGEHPETVRPQCDADDQVGEQRRQPETARDEDRAGGEGEEQQNGLEIAYLHRGSCLIGAGRIAPGDTSFTPAIVAAMQGDRQAGRAMPEGLTRHVQTPLDQQQVPGTARARRARWSVRYRRCARDPTRKLTAQAGPRRARYAAAQKLPLHCRARCALRARWRCAFRQQAGRRCRSRAGGQHQRAGFGDRAEAAGDAGRVVAMGRTCLDLDAGPDPVERREFGPADGAAGQSLFGKVTGDGGRHLRKHGYPVDAGRHRHRFCCEAGSEVSGHRRANPAGGMPWRPRAVPGGCGITSDTEVGPHAGEDVVATARESTILRPAMTRTSASSFWIIELPRRRLPYSAPTKPPITAAVATSTAPAAGTRPGWSTPASPARELARDEGGRNAGNGLSGAQRR